MPILLKWQVVQTKFITEPPSPLVPVLENDDIPLGNLRGKSLKFWNSAQSIWFPVNFCQPSDIEWPLAVHWKSARTKILSSAEDVQSAPIWGDDLKWYSNLAGCAKKNWKYTNLIILEKHPLVVWLKRAQTPFPHCRLAKPFTSDPHFPQYWKLCPPVSVSHPQQFASRPHIRHPKIIRKAF